MTRKILIPTLLFVFILCACTGNVETIQPTTTSIPTSTSTFIPESTVTLTPIPTTTLLQYTSCASPELIQEIKDAFLDEKGSSIEEYLQNLINTGIYETREFYVGGTRTTMYENIVYVGRAEVSLENVGEFSPKDTAFCIYLADDSDPSTLIPVVMGFTHNGEYFKTLGFADKSTGTSESVMPTSMEETRRWWQSNPIRPAIGDIFELYFWDFIGTTDPEEVATFDYTKLTFGVEVSELLKLMNNNYLERISGTESAVEAATRLDPSSDVGLVSSLARNRIRNPLDK